MPLTLESCKHSQFAECTFLRHAEGHNCLTANLDSRYLVHKAAAATPGNLSEMQNPRSSQTHGWSLSSCHWWAGIGEQTKRWKFSFFTSQTNTFLKKYWENHQWSEKTETEMLLGRKEPSPSILTLGKTHSCFCNLTFGFCTLQACSFIKPGEGSVLLLQILLKISEKLTNVTCTCNQRRQCGFWFKHASNDHSFLSVSPTS